MKQLESESTLGHEMHFLLAVRLKALLGQSNNASVASVFGKVECLLDIDAENSFHTIDTF